jgi:hypothetical protein
MPPCRQVEPHAQLPEFNCAPFSDLPVYGELPQNRGGK